jgi:hypothetical protein
MTQEVDAQDWYKRTIEGTGLSKTLSLERKDGRELPKFEMHTVDKQDLAFAIQSMPDELFEAVDEEEDVSAEEAEEMAEEASEGGANVSPEMVTGFEYLCEESLSHKAFSDVQMKKIIDNFGFETLFDIGSEIMTFSIEESGDVQDFHVQD